MSGDKPIAFIVISEAGAIESFDEVVTTALIQEVVGGDFEVIQPTDMDMTLFVNEDGKRLGMNANWLATRLAHSRLRPGDFITGPVLVTGSADDEGDVQPLTPQGMTAIHERTDR
jgi:hypothetical protein